MHINNIGVYKMENKDKIESRRSFLKKAAYAVPTIVALGQITNPVPAAAGSFVGNKTDQRLQIQIHQQEKLQTKIVIILILFLSN